MAFITTGLTNGGVTAHYRFSYDQALAGTEPARTNAVIAACETDYNLMSGWFGGHLNVTGMSVQVTTQSNGASWSGTSSSSTIQLNAQGESYSNNPAYLRYLLIAEVTEIFMMTQNKGWFQGGNEGSKGEGLSRFLSGQFLAQNGFLGVGIDANYAVADLWLNSARQDFVNNAPDDNGYDATNGCTTLFIYYLFHQLGFGIDQIVGGAAATLAGVYKNLTGDPNDPFPVFKQLLDARFPSQTSSAVPGPNFDDPWPLGAESYTGVWRAGTQPYYLWINAGQSDFLAKWQTLAAQSLRLSDLDVTTVNGQDLWSGIWEGGTDAYYLWINADQAHFLAKWTELAAQNLRLVSIRNHNGLFSGVWRGGTDAYYLWVSADQAHFTAKWTELAAQNLRLVDFDVATVNGQRLWSGVWRSGSDGYYLWMNASWPNFVAKWTELAGQNLRLVAVRTYDGLWAGIWRSGTDPYYLWANANESSFLAKWGGLAGQNLRLIDLVTMPTGGAAGAAASAVSAAGVGLDGGRIGSSTMTGGGADDRADVPLELHAGANGAGASDGAGAGGGSLGDGAVLLAAAATGVGEGGGSVGPSAAGSSAQPAATGVGEGGGSAIAGGVTVAPAAVDGAGEGGGSLPIAASQGRQVTVGAGDGGGSLDVAGAALAAAALEGAGEGGGAAPRNSHASGASGGVLSGRAREPAAKPAARKR
jgi:hypothetical protein